MKIQISLIEGKYIFADMAIAILVQNGMSNRKANELLKPHKRRVKGFGNTRFVPMDFVESLLNNEGTAEEAKQTEQPKEERKQEKRSKGGKKAKAEEYEQISFDFDEEEAGFSNDADFNLSNPTDDDLIKAFYFFASPSDYCSTFLGDIARMVGTSPKKLFRRLSKLLHPDSSPIKERLQGWEIDVFKEAQERSIRFGNYETSYSSIFEETETEEEPNHNDQQQNDSYDCDEEQENSEDWFNLDKNMSDEDLLREFYDIAKPNRNRSFLHTLAELMDISPKKLFRRLSKLLHPDTSPFEDRLQGWEIKALMEGKKWCEERGLYESYDNFRF